MKHQAKELSIRIEEERNTRWCRGLYYRLARISHYILYVFLMLMVLLIAYWLRIWPRYPPISTNLSLTGTSTRLNKVQTSPYAKYGVFHKLRSHNARLGKHHRRHFNTKPVNEAQPSGDGEKKLGGYGVHHRNPWNKVREWKENSFHGRRSEDDGESDQVQHTGTGHEMRGEGHGFVEEDRPRMKFPDEESDMMSEKGPDIDDDVGRAAEVRRSEGRLHVRKGQMKKSRRRGKKGKRPVISKKRILAEHAKSRLYGFEEKKTENSNNVNGELNIATIDEDGKIKDIHEKNKYHGNSNIDNLKRKEDIKKMNIPEEKSHQQISSAGNLNKYSKDIKKLTGRRNGWTGSNVKKVPVLKTSLGRSSRKYKANVRSSVLQKKTTKPQNGIMKGSIPEIKSLLKSKANPGGRGTLQRTVGYSVDVHRTTQRSGRVQGTVYQNMPLTEYLAKQRKINRPLAKNIGIVSTPNVSRKSQTGTLYGVRKDGGHKPGARITIITRKIRYPTGNVNSQVKTRSNIALLNNAPNAVSNPPNIHSKPIAPRPEKQHVVVNEVLIPKKTAIPLLKPRINVKLHSPVSGR